MPAGQFRKKPLVIDAWLYTHGSVAKPAWLGAAIDDGRIWYQGGAFPYWTIETPEGEMRAVIGDWIIRGVKGELYPCKPDIFAATYEPVIS